MSSIYDNVLSNMSYTNKDFNSIYAELLDVADKISPEWHPSTSNESDPGVLLLKLDAILADKLNYNIDKNILEVFPDSVTQYPNARQIFEQCGYNMKHYQAAEVIVSLMLDNEPNADNFEEDSPARIYTLPRFTMLTDKDKSVIYTIVDPDIILKSDGLQCEFKALQGVKNDFVLNNERLITYSNLDYNNRIYFKQINVAENGIFIESVNSGIGQANYDEWKKVDNLYAEEPMTRCYKFGVDRDGSKCYIEFTPDIAALIGEGLYITYLTTDGLSGNIGRNTISKFYPGEITASRTEGQTNPKLTPTGATEIAINSDNVYIVNNLPSVNGKNPETISEARKNYMRVKNTFNTLVSLQDYTNFLLTSDEVGNGFVCDRTNDIRSSAKVVTYDGFDESIKTCFRKSDDKDEMNAFNLKIYATKNIYPVTSTDAFELTFDQALPGYIYNLQDDMEEIKCIQHDFIEHEAGQIVNIQLRYPIIARIMPASKLELSQQLEIQQKIIKSLISKLNATEINFGSEISYEDIYDTILKSDSRIRAATLDDITYTPYVIYKTEVRGEYRSMELCPELKVPDADADGLSSDQELHNQFWREIKAKCILAGYSDLFKRTDNFTRMISMTSTSSVKSISQLTTNTELSATITDKKAEIKLEDNESIYLTIPSYITEMSFGNNCKYFYHLNSTVSNDQIYKLSGDEYIMFCWTEDSESTAPYYYAKYSSGTIIQPSIELTGGYNLAEDSSLQKWIAGQLDTDSTKISDSEASGDGKSINALIRSADESILSGTKSIKKLKLNNIDFQSKKTSTSPGYKLYWILNNVTNNEYVLDFSKNDEHTYTLRSGEYLFYTTLSGKSFSLLGAGTKLQLKVDPGMSASLKYSVTAKSYDEVLTGTNNLLNTESLWYELPEHVTISATEMEFYKIADKSLITFTLSSAAQSGAKLTINNNEIKIPENSKIVSISYKSSNGVPQYLPSLSISDAQWEGYSILSLNCSNTKEQKFTIGSSRKQSITYKDGAKDTTWPGLNGSAGTYYLQSSHPLEDIGGIDVDVTAVDYAGRKVPVDLFMYEYQDVAVEGTEEKVQKLSDGMQIAHTLTNSYPFSITGPAIIPVRVALSTSGITINGCSILPATTYTTSTKIEKNGMIYLYSNSKTNSNITISEESKDKYSTIYIYPIIPLAAELDADLLNTMTELDPNNEYNYMHSPDISTYIDNPVAPEAFLLEHHPYNRCTICKWDHGNSELKIINKLR